MADREKILRQLHEGTVKVVCSVGTLTTGVDRDVRCIILARPTKSEMLFVQMVGRGLRPADGKTDLLILDHSSNHARLGFVTDIYHAALDNGEPRPRREPSKPLPSQCPKCAYLKRPQVWECPNCGYAPPRSLPEMLPGRLEEIEQPKADGKEAYFCRELKWHAEENGYKPGWVAVNFKSTRRSASFNGAPTACAMKNISASKS